MNFIGRPPFGWLYVKEFQSRLLVKSVRFLQTPSKIFYLAKKTALEQEYLQLQIEALKNRFAIFLCISITYFVKCANGVKARPKAACRQQQLAYKVFFPAKKQRKEGSIDQACLSLFNPRYTAAQLQSRRLGFFLFAKQKLGKILMSETSLIS